MAVVASVAPAERAAVGRAAAKMAVVAASMAKEVSKVEAAGEVVIKDGCVGEAVHVVWWTALQDKGVGEAVHVVRWTVQKDVGVGEAVLLGGYAVLQEVPVG